MNIFCHSSSAKERMIQNTARKKHDSLLKASLCLVLEILLVSFSVWDIIRSIYNHDLISKIIFDIALYIFCSALAATGISVFVKSFRKYSAIAKAIAECGEQEKDFFRIDCAYTKNILLDSSPYRTTVYGIRICDAHCNEYTYIFEQAPEYPDEALQLTNTLYARRYKDSDLLCEVIRRFD